MNGEWWNGRIEGTFREGLCEKGLKRCISIQTTHSRIRNQIHDLQFPTNFFPAGSPGPSFWSSGPCSSPCMHPSLCCCLWYFSNAYVDCFVVLYMRCHSFKGLSTTRALRTSLWKSPDIHIHPPACCCMCRFWNEVCSILLLEAVVEVAAMWIFLCCSHPFYLFLIPPSWYWEKNLVN